MFLKALFTGFAVAALAMAQGGGMGQSGGGIGGADTGGMGGGGGRGSMEGPEGSGRPMGMRAQKETKADQMLNRLKLSKDQKSEFATILESTAKDAAPVIQQLMQSKNARASAMVNGKSDAELDSLAKAMSGAQFQMTGVEVMAFKRIVGLLKPNQAAKSPEVFELMADIFLPPAGAGGGGGGRRQRGDK